MQQVCLDDLRGVRELSIALHEILQLLRKPPFLVTAGHISRLMDLHPPELTRMRRVHCNPEYARLVSRAALYKVMHYLLQQFPELSMYRAKSGRICIRLYNRCSRKRKKKGSMSLQKPAQTFKRDIKPGGTRWFLLQLAETEPFSGDSGSPQNMF